jgi:hypothetical protein
MGLSVRARTLLSASAVCCAAAALAACSGFSDETTTITAPTPTLGASDTAVAIDPNDFVGRVDNPWFPLKPGTTYRSEGTKEGHRAVDVFTVTGDTKKVMGVTNTVVDDRLFVDGRLEEIARDWYAQDRAGNVWYFGESIQEFNRRGQEIPAKGEWRAGVDGAKPGIAMPADPQLGQAFRPEYYKGTAEDRYGVVSLTAAVTVPYDAFKDVLVMTEQTRLEPGVLGLKFHVRGIGQIMESVPSGPHETLSLVSVKHAKP